MYVVTMHALYVITGNKIPKLETVSIAETLQNRQHAQNPQCCEQYGARERGSDGEVGKEVGRDEGRDGGRREGVKKEGREMEGERKGGR